MTLITRRQLIAASVGAGIAIKASPLQSLLAQSEGPVLGDHQEAFDAAFGTGTPEGDLIRYGDGSDGKAIYRVGFSSSGMSSLIEGDFTPTEGGGLNPEDVVLGDSQFVPTSAGEAVGVMLGTLSLSRSNFYTAFRRNNPDTQMPHPNTGVLVADELGAPEGATGMEKRLLRTTLAAETPEVNDPMVLEKGGWLPVGSTVDEWHAKYGAADGGQTSARIANPPAEGTFLISEREPEVEIDFDTPVSAADAMQMVCNMLPADAGLNGSFWTPPTESGPVGMRVQWWQVGEGGTQYSTLQYVTDGEESGTVDRIIVASFA